MKFMSSILEFAGGVEPLDLAVGEEGDGGQFGDLVFGAGRMLVVRASVKDPARGTRTIRSETAVPHKSRICNGRPGP